MKRSLLEKCLEDHRDYFLKLCRIGIEHPRLAPKVLVLLEKMALMDEDAAILEGFMVKMRKGDRGNVPAR